MVGGRKIEGNKHILEDKDLESPSEIHHWFHHMVGSLLQLRYTIWLM